MRRRLYLPMCAVHVIRAVHVTCKNPGCMHQGISFFLPKAVKIPILSWVALRLSVPLSASRFRRFQDRIPQGLPFHSDSFLSTVISGREGGPVPGYPYKNIYKHI